jgi:hypothetical protein
MRIKNAYNILVETSEEKEPFGRPKHRWNGLKEIWCDDVDWIYLAQGKVQWRAFVFVITFDKYFNLKYRHSSMKVL